MSTAWTLATTSLGRRLRFLRRYRWWALQLLVAVPGIVLVTHDTGTADSSHVAKLWHDAALFFFVLAATLRVWRAPEEGTAEMLRFRLLHRKVAWRAFTVLLLAGSLALAADRWCTWKGDGPAARGWSTAAWVLVWLAVAARLLEPLVWLLWPQELRRGVKLARLAEDAAKVTARHSTRAAIPPTVFADQGAFGRTRASYQSHGGPPSPEPQSVPAQLAGTSYSARGRRLRASPPVLHWDGTRLAWSDAQGHTHMVPVAGRPALKGSVDRGVRPVAEMVWLLHTGARLGPSSLLVLLDDKGYRFLVLHTNQRSFGPCADLAEAVGVPFAAYRIAGDAQAFRTLLNSLFPHRGPVVELRAAEAGRG
ncbi:hypothetical protein ABUW04_00785 [Streptacidiphilus sp. N1-10]|uniref:Uncharacterized protein n=1 Tax=Streptacidiphilus jeojiensis TaxID=3229225 RepID=A0ABV6XEV1_9ACTN